MLAHHYLSALELDRAADRDAADLAPGARHALQGAGDRALALNAFATAVGYYQAALALWPEDERKRGADRSSGWRWRGAVRVRTKMARPLNRRARPCSRLVTGPGQPKPMPGWGELWWLKGQRDRSIDHLERAQALVRDEPPSAGKAHVLSELARYRMLADEFDPETGRETWSWRRRSGLDEVQANVLITIGMGRTLTGDPQGTADIQRGLEIALAGNFLAAAVRG